MRSNKGDKMYKFNEKKMGEHTSHENPVQAGGKIYNMIPCGKEVKLVPQSEVNNNYQKTQLRIEKRIKENEKTQEALEQRTKKSLNIKTPSRLEEMTSKIKKVVGIPEGHADVDEKGHIEY